MTWSGIVVPLACGTGTVAPLDPSEMAEASADAVGSPPDGTMTDGPGTGDVAAETSADGGATSDADGGAASDADARSDARDGSDARGNAAVGTWVNALPVTVTMVDAATGDYTATGESSWSGTLTGTTKFTVIARLDPMTGAQSGTIDETFTASSGTGTLRFTETFTEDASGNVHIDAHVVSGTGEYARTTGDLVFTGTLTPAGTGDGEYHGVIDKG